MKVFHIGALALVLSLHLGAGSFAQDATIQMRPDEAFWNAIRDSGSADSINLFIATHPDSPYVKDARAALAALENSAAGSVPAASVEAAVVDAPPPAKRPSLAELIDALDVLGVRPELPEGQEPEESLLEGYVEPYRIYAGRDPGAAVTDAELREIMVMAESSWAWSDAGYGKFVLDQILDRLRLVHETLIAQPAPAELAELIDALQTHYGLPRQDVISTDLLVAVLAEQVVLPHKAEGEILEFRDWILLIQPATTYTPRSCYLYPRPDQVTWSGPLLTYLPPGGPRFVYSEGSGSSMVLFYAPGDQFISSTTVVMRAGGREFPLAFVDDGLSQPKFDEPKKANGDYLGEGVAFLRRASGTVTLAGRSRWDLPLDVMFSANGFTKAFQAINEQCAEGQLDVWLR